MRKLAIGAVLWVLAAAGPAVAGSPTLMETERQAVRRYANAVVLRILRDQSYPARALEWRIEGSVTVAARIGRDGRVKSAHVKASSGSDILDAAALEKVLVTTSLPDPPPPLRDREFVLEVPIVFRIERPSP
jgi:TonB family protein